MEGQTRKRKYIEMVEREVDWENRVRKLDWAIKESTEKIEWENEERK